MTMKQRTALTLVSAMTIIFCFGYANAHSGPLNEIAVTACVNKEKSQMCQYEGGHNDLYIGTCQYMADNLMCVRNQPIQFIEQAEGTDEVEHDHNDNKYDFN